MFLRLRLSVKLNIFVNTLILNYNTMKKLLLLSLLFISIFSCSKEDIAPPKIPAKAEFTYHDQGEGMIAFINGSTNSNLQEWDFGDFQKSSNKNPIHTYSKNGTYQVKLTAMGEGGNDVVVKNVVVNNLKGSLLVYKKFSNGNSNINVWVDGTFIGIINGGYYFTSAPSCGNGSSVTAYNLSEGQHSVVAKEVTSLFPSTWSTTSTIIGGQCSSMGLTN